MTPMLTRWGKAGPGDVPHPEHPRPQFRRDEWLTLNGWWDFAIAPRHQSRAETYPDKILVPFPIESTLSGIARRLDPKERAWYRREVHVPGAWRDRDTDVLLHFGAVDYQAEVLVNGQPAGSNTGGHVPFTFTITPLLADGAGEIVVAAWDPTGKGLQERGKQALKPWGILYTAVSGIWQTAWLEAVPKSRIGEAKLTPDLDAGKLVIDVDLVGTRDLRAPAVAIEVREAGATVASGRFPGGGRCELAIPGARPWSPDDPFLYEVVLELVDGTTVLDRVDAYAGMRKIAIKASPGGAPRIELNNAFTFQYGPLDQGWWPDGLYTAPSDDALRFDVERTKALGFNMTRKHVKVEPARWYHHCDTIGLLVWQDMPSGGKSWWIPCRSPAGKRRYLAELERMVRALWNVPSIIGWVPFNEGWGQFDTRKVTDLVHSWDPTRIVDSASGWFNKKCGDVHSIHAYPGPKMPGIEPGRALALSEFGGLGLLVDGHAWPVKRRFAYKTFDSPGSLTGAYLELLRRLSPMVSRGLSAAVYTQLTDVEGEINGLYTYDREVLKIDEQVLVAAHRDLVNGGTPPT